MPLIIVILKAKIDAIEIAESNDRCDFQQFMA